MEIGSEGREAEEGAAEPRRVCGGHGEGEAAGGAGEGEGGAGGAREEAASGGGSGGGGSGAEGAEAVGAKGEGSGGGEGGRVNEERGVGEEDLAGFDGAGGDESPATARELSYLHQGFRRRHRIHGGFGTSIDVASYGRLKLDCRTSPSVSAVHVNM